VSEGSGWTGRLGRLLNARMEEMSFRSGVAVAAGVLALTGVGIALTVTPIPRPWYPGWWWPGIP
jgi:hypothetical protein